MAYIPKEERNKRRDQNQVLQEMPWDDLLGCSMDQNTATLVALRFLSFIYFINLFQYQFSMQLYFISLLIYLFVMIVPEHNLDGIVFSIYALAITVPVCFIFKRHCRSIDALQITYLFALLWASSTNTFSTNLYYSWISFGLNFLNFCTAGDVVCTAGFQLSFSACLVGLLLLLLIIVSVEKCKKPNIHFEPIYCFFKGMFKWAYLPLVSYSGTYLCTAIINSSSITVLIPSAVILAICAVFPFAQLIGYTCIQQEGTSIWVKWLQFFNYARSFLVAALMIVGLNYDAIAYHFIWGPLVLYAAIVTWKGDYHFKVMEKVFFVLGEAVIITLFGLFLYGGNSYIELYDLDFFGLGGILLGDLIMKVVLAARLVKYGREDDGNKVNPEEYKLPQESIGDVNEGRSNERGKQKKPNKYDNQDQDYTGVIDSPSKVQVNKRRR